MDSSGFVRVVVNLLGQDHTAPVFLIPSLSNIQILHRGQSSSFNGICLLSFLIDSSLSHSGTDSGLSWPK